jgi:hypothetical protein
MSAHDAAAVVVAPQPSAAKLKARHVRFLAYLAATRGRYDGYRAARCGLAPTIEAGETDKLVASVERHKRDPQTGGGLALPLEVLVDVLSYLPPPSGGTGTVTREARGAVTRVMQTCTLMLFLVLENSHVARPPPFRHPEPPSAVPARLAPADARMACVRSNVALRQLKRELRGAMRDTDANPEMRDALVEQIVDAELEVLRAKGDASRTIDEHRVPEDATLDELARTLADVAALSSSVADELTPERCALDDISVPKKRGWFQ